MLHFSLPFTFHRLGHGHLFEVEDAPWRLEDTGWLIFTVAT